MAPLAVTNADRVVFPDDGITKGEIVAYYEAVADRMLPHVARRPLTLERFRATIADGGFFQKAASKHFPDVVGRIEVDKAEGGTITHPSADRPEALPYLANQGALTLHAWAARAPDLEHPDALVLDLDPPDDAGFDPVRAAAGHLRHVLDDHGLRGHPMLTGSRGIHVVVPLDRTATWEEIWPVAKLLGAALVKRAPKELTRAFYRSQRRGRLYVDTARARRAHTAIVPYSVRARATAPVAAPIAWEELEDPALHARSFTVRTILDRDEDPWAGIWHAGQSLQPLREQLP